MAVNRPTYATRRMVKSATDIQQDATYDDQVDSALEDAAESVDGLCHRRFYNVLETASWDWPNFQRAYPWRIWFEERELATVTDPAPTVVTGGTTIPATDGNGLAVLLWGPWNYAPPYTFLELNRASSYAYGLGPTPQKDVSILGRFGYWNRQRAAGALAIAVSDTTSTGVTVTDSSTVDVGDVIIVDTEWMLVADNGMADTGQTIATGMTADASDQALPVQSGTALHKGEIVQVDQEQMLITSIAGATATVNRGYNGTTLAAHTSTTAIYAARLLTVTRGDFGSTAATHTNATAVAALLVPGEVRELAAAEALNTVYQKVSAYARTIGENARPVPGGSLPDLRSKVYARYGRQQRQAVI